MLWCRWRGDILPAVTRESGVLCKVQREALLCIKAFSFLFKRRTSLSFFILNNRYKYFLPVCCCLSNYNSSFIWLVYHSNLVWALADNLAFLQHLFNHKIFRCWKFWVILQLLFHRVFGQSHLVCFRAGVLGDTILNYLILCGNVAILGLWIG